ncbi:hypothetical protein E2562_007016, partial [Oryza meyeriana var. granulata]
NKLESQCPRGVGKSALEYITSTPDAILDGEEIYRIRLTQNARRNRRRGTTAVWSASCWSKTLSTIYLCSSSHRSPRQPARIWMPPSDSRPLVVFDTAKEEFTLMATPHHGVGTMTRGFHAVSGKLCAT